MDQTLSGNLGFKFTPKTQEELYFLAYMDPLTTTYNRNMLEEMRKELDSRMLYITIVDIDNLKIINDKEGHHAGDRAIQYIADRLKKLSEAVFRLGGDEFLLIDQQPVDPGVILGISYGCIWKRAEEKLSDTMKLADTLMYADKHAKKIARLKTEVNAAFGVPKSILDSVQDTGYEFFKSTFMKGGAEHNDDRAEGQDGISGVSSE